MIQIWQVCSECGPSNLVVLGLTDTYAKIWCEWRGGHLAPKAPTSLKGHDVIDNISYQPNIKEVQGLHRL